MKTNHISLLILQIFLLFQIVSSDSDICSSNFDTKKAELCSKLGTSENPCYFIYDECRDWFKECAEYSPESNFDENICQKITPSNNLKKCQVETNSGIKSCIEVDKACEDLSDKTCFNLNLGTDKRCILINGKCQEHYNSCDGLSEDKCANNIPNTNKEKCVWVESTSKCVSQERQCQDFIEYSENGKSNLACDSLKSTTNKICFMYGNKCEEAYKTCGVITEQTACENNIPQDCYGTCTFEKCVWENDACTKIKRTCSDYKKREYDQWDYCSVLGPENPEQRTYKACSLNRETDTCEEVYKSCESYNGLISEDERTEEDCTAIDPGNTVMNQHGGSKCSFDKTTKTCKEVYNDCEDQTLESCLTYRLQDTNKYCIIDKGLCITQYDQCEIYNDEVEEANRSKEDCESILPRYISEVNSYKCVFTESKTCEKLKLETCEDYEGNNEDFCNKIKLAESKTYHCVFNNNKCTTQFQDCLTYNGQTDKNKEACESIILSDKSSKCLFDNALKSCYSKKKQCEDFYDSSDEECGNHQTSKIWNVVCAHENNKCVEKTNYVYETCYYYSGKDKSICEAIIPKTNSIFGKGIIYGEKCVIDNVYKSCKSINKVCSEAKDAKECYSITPSDSSNKHCVFINNVCIEQYKTCTAYENSENTLNKETCESIIIDKDNKNKCVFTEGKDGSKGACRSEAKKCSDFNIKSLAKECSDLSSSLPNDTKKCNFSDNVCTTIDKTSCAELGFSINSTEEICKNAITTSPKIKCGYKLGKCKEENVLDKVDENESDNKSSDKTIDDKATDGKKTDNKIIDDGDDYEDENEDDDTDYARQNYLNKFLFILLCVMV